MKQSLLAVASFLQKLCMMSPPLMDRDDIQGTRMILGVVDEMKPAERKSVMSVLLTGGLATSDVWRAGTDPDLAFPGSRGLVTESGFVLSLRRRYANEVQVTALPAAAQEYARTMSYWLSELKEVDALVVNCNIDSALLFIVDRGQRTFHAVSALATKLRDRFQRDSICLGIAYGAFQHGYHDVSALRGPKRPYTIFGEPVVQAERLAHAAACPDLTLTGEVPHILFSAAAAALVRAAGCRLALVASLPGRVESLAR
ncbi:MAG: hypothetical protein IT452_14400 [Planctomycetia bacterium]|nr:hypothetical protein [Planctomycetia bacterium]